MKLKFKFIILVIFSIISVSCLDDNLTDFGKGPIIVQFSDKEITSNFLQVTGEDKVYDYEVSIEYQGANGMPLNKAVTVTVGVNAKSKAKEGVEFSLPVKEYTIPAGEKTAKVMVKVNSKTLDASNPKAMILEITNSSETVSDKNTVSVTLQAICPSKLEGNYTYESGKKRTVDITSNGPGVYTVSSSNFFGGKYSYNISDVCGTIKVTGGYISDNFSIPESGSGTVDPTTGNITIFYTAKGYFKDKKMVLVKN